MFGRFPPRTVSGTQVLIGRNPGDLTGGDIEHGHPPHGADEHAAFAIHYVNFERPQGREHALIVQAGFVDASCGPAISAHLDNLVNRSPGWRLGMEFCRQGSYLGTRRRVESRHAIPQPARKYHQADSDCSGEDGDGPDKDDPTSVIGAPGRRPGQSTEDLPVIGGIGGATGRFGR
jgi:hypothetical protein